MNGSIAKGPSTPNGERIPDLNSSPDIRLKVLESYEAMSREAASLFAELAIESVETCGRFAIVLSGGSTPRRMYELLAGPAFVSRVPWKKVHVFWGDERCVPLESKDSNVGEAIRILLDHVPVDDSQIHPIDGGLPPAQSAAEYEQTIREFFGDQPPRFDLILLGLGTNGHTASLFPHTKVLKESNRLVSEVFVEELKSYRISLTVPVINQADNIAFLASGGDKAEIVREVLEGHINRSVSRHN